MYDRSPVHFIDQVRGAVLSLEGLNDPVVPATGRDDVRGAPRAGIPCASLGTRVSSTGFRDAANIARTLESGSCSCFAAGGWG